MSLSGPASSAPHARWKLEPVLIIRVRPLGLFRRTPARSSWTSPSTCSARIRRRLLDERRTFRNVVPGAVNPRASGFPRECSGGSQWPMGGSYSASRCPCCAADGMARVLDGIVARARGRPVGSRRASITARAASCRVRPVPCGYAEAGPSAGPDVSRDVSFRFAVGCLFHQFIADRHRGGQT